MTSRPPASSLPCRALKTSTETTSPGRSASTLISRENGFHDRILKAVIYYVLSFNVKFFLCLYNRVGNFFLLQDTNVGMFEQG